MDQAPDALRAWIADIVKEEVARALKDAASSEYMSTAEAATFARVSGDTLRRWVKDGKLEAFKAGRELRFKRKDLEGLMSGTSGKARVMRRSKRREELARMTPEEIAAIKWGLSR